MATSKKKAKLFTSFYITENFTKMVNYCCVRGCGRNNKSNKHLYFYSIPKDHRQKLWIEASGRTEIFDKPQEKRTLYRICSRHFSPSSFKNKRISTDAVPSLYLPGVNIDEDGREDASDDEQKLHQNITCNSCGDNITRFRYKCITCRNYDLCSRCEMTETHSHHIMLRIPTPTTFKSVDKMVKKWQAFQKEANASTDSSDDEPITKYVKNYDSGVDLSDDVKEALRNEVTRVLAIKPSHEKKKQASLKKRPSEVEKPRKIQKVNDTVDLRDFFENSTEMVFADVNEIRSVGSSQPIENVKNDLLISFEPNEEPALPMMQMKLSEDLSELMMEVSEPNKY